MATCVISGTLKDITDTAIQSANIRARLLAPAFVSTVLYAPEEVTTTTATDGTWSLTLTQGLSVLIIVEYPPNSTDSKLRYSYTVTVPAAASAAFSTLATEA